MHVADQPAVVDVAHDALDRGEGVVDVRRILHREDEAGHDHDDEHETSERTEVPPVVQVLRRRIFIRLVMQVAEDRQTVVDPADDGVLEDGSSHDSLSSLSRSSRGFGFEGVLRHLEIERRGTAADAAGRVIFRTVARAEPAAEVAGLAERHATEMREKPTMTIQFSLPSPAERSTSVAGASDAMLALRATGSFSSDIGTALAASISSGVRLRMNTGLPRHLAVSDMPGCSEETSTSTEASASVEASGRIWSMNGQARPATAPPAATAAAIWMKSRRFGSSPAAWVSGFAPATVSATLKLPFVWGRGLRPVGPFLKNQNDPAFYPRQRFW